MVALAVAQAAEIEALMKRKDYRMRISAVTLGIDSKDSLEKLFKEKRGCKVKRISERRLCVPEPYHPWQG